MSQGKAGSKVLYFSANLNGEAEVITVLLRNVGSVKKLKWDLDFADLQIKGRAVKGNTVSKYSILRIELKEKGVSTLKPRDIWFDETIRRLNFDDRGTHLGAFKGEDKLLIVSKRGAAKVVAPELSLHFDDDMLRLEKWVPEKPLTAVYFDSEKSRYFIKRFLIESENKEDDFVKPEGELIFFNSDWRPVITIDFVKPKGKEPLTSLEINAEEFISIKGYKALGNQLTDKNVKAITLKELLPYDNKPEDVNEIEVHKEDVNTKYEITPEEDEESQIKLDF
jgi:topoisomerase-4 subunit A